MACGKPVAHLGRVPTAPARLAALVIAACLWLCSGGRWRWIATATR